MTSSILLVLGLVISPTSICGGGGRGGAAVTVIGWLSGSLSVVVFHALSSPVSAKTNLLLGRRFSMLVDSSSYESFALILIYQLEVLNTRKICRFKNCCANVQKKQIFGVEKRDLRMTQSKERERVSF